MKYFLRAIIILIPMFIVTFILKYGIKYGRNKKKKEVEETFSEEGCILKMPELYKIVPCMVIIFAVIMSIYTLLAQFEDWPYLIILWFFFGLPSITMLICFSVWKVEVRKEEFVYRNFLGKIKIYEYKDLEHRYDERGLKWYFYKDGKKVFCMPYYIENGNKLERVYKKYQTKNRNKLKDEIEECTKNDK
jgi:hypothetical protein